MNKLRSYLRQHYFSDLCYIRRAPWEIHSRVSISDVFRKPALYHRIKTSKREHKENECETGDGIHKYINKMRRFFDNVCPLEDSSTSESDKMYYLRDGQSGIFKIKQNNVPPRRICISGYPGVGKTALLKILAHEWISQEEESGLKGVQLLIFITLNNVSTDAMLGDEIIKQNLPEGTELSGQEIEECIKRHGKDVVMVFDEFDQSPFASLPPDEKDIKYGTLYSALKYEAFRSNLVIVTNRIWKKYQFQGDLFNPYAEIVLLGFAPDSINSFITEYCKNKEMENKVRGTLSKNLSSLLPIARIPMFLVIICKMIEDDTFISKPYTLTKIIQGLFNSLVRTYCMKFQHDETFKGVKYYRVRMEECVQVIGRMLLSYEKLEFRKKMILSEYIITKANRDLIHFGCKVGLISIDFKTQCLEPIEVKEYLTRACFFHDLIADFCIAKVLLSDIRFLMDQTIATQFLTNYNKFYIQLFVCGLQPMTSSAGFSFTSRFTNELATSQSELSGMEEFQEGVKVRQIDLFFEGQMAGNDSLDLTMFERDNELSVDMTRINSFSATEYFMLSVCKTRPDIVFTVFSFRGDEYLENDGDMFPTNKQDNVFGVHGTGVIHTFVSNCQFLTTFVVHSITLKIEHDVSYDFDIRSRKSMKLIMVHYCVGLNVVRHLFYYAFTQLPCLRHFALNRVYQAHCDIQSETLKLEHVMHTLKNLVVRSEALNLAGVSFESQTLTSSDRLEIYLDCFFLQDCLQEINLASLLLFLKEKHVTCLWLEQCSLLEMPNTGIEVHAREKSSEQFHLMIRHCKSKVPVFQVLHIMSSYYPSTQSIYIHSSEVTFNEVETPVLVPTLQFIMIGNCKSPIDINDVTTGVQRSLKYPPTFLAFKNCNFTSKTTTYDSVLQTTFVNQMDFTNCHLSSTIISRCLLFSDKIVVAFEKEQDQNGIFLSRQRDALVIFHRKDGEIEVNLFFDFSELTADDVMMYISKVLSKCKIRRNPNCFKRSFFPITR